MFTNCKTLEELKKAYHEAIKAAHPDNGGKVEDAAEINAAYRVRFEQVKNIHQNKNGEMYEKDTEETPEVFINLIAQLYSREGLEIEILGSFVWVGGKTKENKDFLKALGFKWSKNKSLWYLAPAGYHRYGHDEWSMDKIRATYKNYGTYTTDGHGQLALIDNEQ